MAFRLEYVDHSWTKRQLKEECGDRGLANFSHLNKEVLIRMLNHDTATTPPGWVPHLRKARVEAQRGQWDLAIEGFQTYLRYHVVMDSAWHAVSNELQECLAQEAHEQAEYEREQAEYEQQMRLAEEARLENERRAAAWRLAKERRLAEERIEAERRREVQYQESLRAAARAAAAEEQRRRQAEYQEHLRAAEAAARTAAAAEQRRNAEARARVGERRGIPPGQGSWSFGRASPGEAYYSSGATQAAVPTRMLAVSARFVPTPSVQVRSDSNSSSTNENSSSNNSNGNDCSICMDAEVNCTLVPCGHLCCCFECAATFSQCPVCRATVQMKVKTYRA